MPDLTPKQARFVAEYLVDLNATQAAIRTGYAPKTANREGSRLLSKAVIAAEIERQKAAQLAALNLRAVDVLEEMRRVGFSDLAEAFDETGALKRVRDLPRAFRSALASVKVTKKNLIAGDGKTEDVVELRLWDKPQVLANLAKHFGLLKESVEHTGGIVVKWQTS